LRVDKLTVGKAFDLTERLEAPLFQRPYVWNEEDNWSPLWKAIQLLAEKHASGQTVRPHFLGAIVLDQVQTQMGHLPVRQIIDGQQRLTTLQLALAACRDLSQFLEKANYAQAFAKLVHNEVPLSDEPIDRIKVLPTNADREEFIGIIQAGSIEAAIQYAKTKKTSLIAGAYVYFSDTLLAWLPEQEDARTRLLDALYRTIKDSLVLVAIDLENDDDAQEIFETLNTLGTPLLTADIVKNYLIRLAERRSENTQRLYQYYWSDFDAEKSYWREEIGRGRQKRNRIDIFLLHYVTLHTAKEINASQLFSAFRDFVITSHDNSAEHQMALFRAYAEVYAGFGKQPAGSFEALFFYRMSELEMSTAFPLLLEVFKKFSGPEYTSEREQILTDLESYFVRRAVCELGTRSYGKVVVSLLQFLKQNGFSAAKIRNFLIEETSDSSRWPNDEEFGKAWLRLNFYKKLKRASLRVILEALEKAQHGTKTELLSRDLTVEHLMPRRWEQHWSLPSSMDQREAEDRREELIHSIGNLTLLTKSLNPSVSNGPWTKKREAILKHSALNLNRSLPTEWTEKDIKSRADALLMTALDIWPRDKAFAAKAP
jgi:uncharacterized protein with ParB-like and HNH nuclease domain